MSEYEEGYRQGLKTSAHYREEARAYKEAYVMLLERIASLKALDPPPPIVIQAAPQQTCQHEWVSAKNQYVKNGSVCPKCGAIDAREPEELAAPQQYDTRQFSNLTNQARGFNITGAAPAVVTPTITLQASYGGAQPVAQPVAWMRKWAYDNEKMSKERNENGRMAWPTKFKLLPVTQGQCLRDDVPLYAAPQQAQQT